MDYRSLLLDRDGPVATVRLRPITRSFGLTPPAEVHEEVGHVMSALRIDDSTHVVVLTGEISGEFVIPPLTSQYSGGGQSSRLADPKTEWGRGTGVIRAHQAMAEMEKPIIAKVNGDAIGFGSSLLFSCDLIIAREDAKICDMHLGLGQVRPSRGGEPVGPNFSMFPGDGGLSVVPLFMSPARAKEYLFLARDYTAAEMNEFGWINAAVPAQELDAAVDDLVARLLERSPDILGYAKRVANRRIVDHMNMTLDAAAAYEHVSIRQWLDASTLPKEA
jgi:enoyl-CoA hydratase/carnithine racemase